MRLSLFFLMLILLPVATGVHAWLFCRDNLPSLTQEAIDRLKKAGVTHPVVEIRFFDIAVTGEAQDPASCARALTSIRSLGPLRLLPEGDRLHVLANLKAKLDNNRLHINGWLPKTEDVANVRQVLSELRPDLQVRTEDLHTSQEVRWPEGVKPPLTVNSPLLKPIINMLFVPAELHIEAKNDVITLHGLLPATSLKEELVSALAEVAGARVVDPEALKASPHVLPASFAKPKLMTAFVREFFSMPPPRSFDIKSDGVPHLQGLATRQMESTWLSLLRPVTGAAKVDAQLTLMPSIYHFPGYQTRSVLPPEKLQALREGLRGLSLLFAVGSSSIFPEEQTKLAALAPMLLAAGPALGLVIGAHPDPVGPDKIEKAVGKARAEAVLSFLIDQGVPAADVSAVVFDPVPSGSPSAPTHPRSVELLIK